VLKVHQPQSNIGFGQPARTRRCKVAWSEESKNPGMLGVCAKGLSASIKHRFLATCRDKETLGSME
jgi:hypothetical protein